MVLLEVALSMLLPLTPTALPAWSRALPLSEGYGKFSIPFVSPRRDAPEALPPRAPASFCRSFARRDDGQALRDGEVLAYLVLVVFHAPGSSHTAERCNCYRRPVVQSWRLPQVKLW
jgi:hypothetical protein